MSAERSRPFCFDIDADLEITGAVLEPESVEPHAEDIGLRHNHSSSPIRAGDRVPGVWVTHKPTGQQVISTQMPTRDENLAVALRRLDRMVRRATSADR